MNELKQNRLTGIISKNVSDIIQFELKDPVGIVTVTGVDLTADYSLAKVYISILGNEKQVERSYDSLLKQKSFIRTKLSKKLSIRKCPDLQFVIDKSIEYGNHIEELLEKIKQG